MKYPNIDAERARRGMSSESLALRLGVSRKTLYNWCNCGNIPQSALLKMSEIFNCSIDYLLECKDQPCKLKLHQQLRI